MTESEVNKNFKYRVLREADVCSESNSSPFTVQDIPDATSNWDAVLFPSLRVETNKELFDPEVVFTNGYISLLSKEKIGEFIRLVTSREIAEQLHCLEDAVQNAFQLNYVHISHVPRSEIQQMSQHIKEWCKDFMLKKSSDHIKDTMTIFEVFGKKFADQLMYMASVEKEGELTDGMLQQLFIYFIEMLGLNSCGFSNIPNRVQKIGSIFVTSAPDAVILTSEPGEMKTIAVVEVKKEYSRLVTDFSPRRKKTKTDHQEIQSDVTHVSSNLRGQLLGEMISYLPTSVFGSSGIFGVIVQGTKVTLASLVTEHGYFDKLEKGYLEKKEAKLEFSREYDILSHSGRHALVKPLFHMSLLLQLLS